MHAGMKALHAQKKPIIWSFRLVIRFNFKFSSICMDEMGTWQCGSSLSREQNQRPRKWAPGMVAPAAGVSQMYK
jgi:hypothetical protein